MGCAEARWGRAAARRRFRCLQAHFQRFGDWESSVRAELLHDERAVQAQKRCLQSFDDALLPVQTPEKGCRKHINGEGPVENGDDHGSRQLDGRLFDREHHPAVLAAVAVVLVVARRARLGGVIVPVVGRRPILVLVVGGVIMTRPVGVHMGQPLALAIRSRSLARDASAEPRVEVAAAKRHRYREQHGHQKPEWTVAMEHASLEYIGGHGTTLRTRGFDFRRAVGSGRSVQGAFRQNGWILFVIEGVLSRFNRQHWPTSPRSPVRIGSPRLWIRGQSAK